jgi:hypothetical protein
VLAAVLKAVEMIAGRVDIKVSARQLACQEHNQTDELNDEKTDIIPETGFHPD